jgi:uncharacterized protein (TIGR02444 family)
MSSGFPDEPFWDFSLAVYGTEGVPAACLGLQERYQIDVNLLLWCLWCGAAGFPALTPDDLAETESGIGDWHHNVVRYLRWLRRHLKAPYDLMDNDLQQSLRARLQKIEIDAEHLEQLALAGIARSLKGAPANPGASVDVSASNGALYLTAAGARATGEDADDFAAILVAAYKDQDPDKVRNEALSALQVETGGGRTESTP